MAFHPRLKPFHEIRLHHLHFQIVSKLLMEGVQLGHHSLFYVVNELGPYLQHQLFFF